jgi:hypothetical protein
MRLSLILLLGLVLAGCSKKPDVIVYGHDIYSKTEKGRLKAHVPSSFDVGSPATYEKIIAAAQKELGAYTANPSGWEWRQIARWYDDPTPFFTVMFTCPKKLGEFIIVPIAPDGHGFGTPSIAADK